MSLSVGARVVHERGAGTIIAIERQERWTFGRAYVDVFYLVELDAGDRFSAPATELEPIATV